MRADRTFRMLRTDVSAMIYRVLKIENRHGSADDQFAVASTQGSQVSRASSVHIPKPR